ncbi:MAG TPA: ABC transporter ATP-binding protein [Anaerolineales bacterium]|nr:ABC transporter ATP-binding protein [Anaerolineales bacterium]
MAAIIETRGLTKWYGKRPAVADLDLAVEEGSVYGFVGPNGAGKTTTMRILATLLAPTAGEAWVAGHSVTKDRRAVRRAIGYMPDFFGVYGEMRVWEYLDFFAACYEIPAPTRRRLVGDLLELVDLAHRREDYVDSLSRGMKQRLCLARALVHDPQVLILDEPASGLDPRARVEIRELIRELQAMGKTIFVSSHILSEIEEVCTHIGIIEAGRLVVSGPLAEIRRQIQVQRTVRIGLMDRVEEAQAWLAAHPDVLQVEPVEPNGEGDLRVALRGEEEALPQLLGALMEAGFRVTMFREEKQDLEDIFLRLTKGIVS